MLSRRTFLLSSISTGLVLSYGNIFNFAAAQVLDGINYQQLASRWVDIITGRNLINPKDQRYTNALTGLDKQVKKFLDDLELNQNRQQIFKSIPLNTNKSPPITQTARAINTILIAWSTPGSEYFNNKQILEIAISAFQDFLTLCYNPSQEEYDNWWDWESGAARAVADIMCIVQQQLPQHIMQAANAALHHFIPNPFYLRTTKAAGNTRQDTLTDDNRTLSTGANRIDLCRSVICAGIATGEAERIKQGLNGLSDTWRLVDRGDGFYADGSFIQHNHIPYTGSYGDVLLTGLSMLFTLVADSSFNIPQEQREQVYQHIDNAYIPVIVDGQVLDNVRGRSVSRLNEPGSMHGASIMKSILLLAQGAPENYRNKWQSICVAWIKRNQYNQFDKQGSIIHLSLVIDALSNNNAILIPQVSKMFPSMDRLVHRTDSWVVSIAMCSNRISWYECGNQENEWASRTGSGMRYLYLKDNMDQFEDGFWPTLDYTAPTGTTVDTHPLERKAAGEWGHNTPQNEWTAGLTQEQVSLAAMHLIGPDNNGLTARKMWFATQLGVIELITDVQTSDNYAFSVIEHRNLGQNITAELSIDQHSLGQQIIEKEYHNPKQASLTQVADYQFLTPIKLIAKIEQRTGSWIEINPARKSAKAEEKITRYWATMQVKHQPEQSTAWVIYPYKSSNNTRIKPHDIELIKNDNKAQIIHVDDKYRAWAIWQPGIYQEWEFVQPTLLLSIRQQEKLHLSLVEPTQQKEYLTIILPGKWLPPEHIKYSYLSNNTKLTFDTKGLAGKAIICELLAV